MCPHCGEALIILEMEGIEIDHCIACGGTWLDAGELELLAEFEGAPPGELSRSMTENKAEKRSSRRCLRCNRKMDTILVGKHRIELERCPYGHGLWLDRGELQLIIADYHAGEEGIVANFFADLYKHELQSNMKDD